MATFDIGTLVRYGARLHVVVAVTPIGVQPRLLDPEDIESGRIRRVQPNDPGIELESVEREQIRDEE